MSNIIQDRYEKICNLGAGSGGDVYLCKVLKPIKRYNSILEKMQHLKQNKEPQKEVNYEYVAIKTFKAQYTGQDTCTGLNPDVIHEIRFMKQFQTENIAKAIDIFTIQEGKAYKTHIVMEFYLPLNKILEETHKFNLQELKHIAYQLIKSLHILHSKYVVHRDIKRENIFIDRKGNLVIGDLGLSRNYGSPLREMTTNFGSRYYRAPEVFFEVRMYQEKSDIWSLGVIIAELFIEWPQNLRPDQRYLFYGDSDMQTLKRIFTIRGTPNEKDWPGFNKLPKFYNAVMMKEAIPIKNYAERIGNNKPAIDLIDKMLQICPSKRITAQQCLEHEFFKDYQELPSFTTQLAEKNHELLEQTIKENQKSNN